MAGAVLAADRDGRAWSDKLYRHGYRARDARRCDRRGVAAASVEEPLGAITSRAGVVAAVDLVMVELVAALDGHVHDALDELA